MTKESQNPIATHAKLTSYGSAPVATVIDAVCGRAELDGKPHFDASFHLDYPLLKYVCESSKMSCEPLADQRVYVEVHKVMACDLEEERKIFGAFGSKAVQEIFPDWMGEDIHTEISIQNLPNEKLHSSEHFSIEITMVFTLSGELREATIHTSPARQSHGAGTSFKITKGTISENLAPELLRIIAHELDQKERLPWPFDLSHGGPPVAVEVR